MKVLSKQNARTVLKTMGKNQLGKKQMKVKPIGQKAGTVKAGKADAVGSASSSVMKKVSVVKKAKQVQKVGKKNAKGMASKSKAHAPGMKKLRTIKDAMVFPGGMDVPTLDGQAIGDLPRVRRIKILGINHFNI